MNPHEQFTWHTIKRIRIWIYAPCYDYQIRFQFNEEGSVCFTNSSLLNVNGQGFNFSCCQLTDIGNARHPQQKQGMENQWPRLGQT